ncbi:hypothetical protein PBCVCvsA1_055R [Paramecium bursaria Chlorella virus CvsA1]|nr:hypothetical protein PBCVCvsA1_055R [Paramecium bursaria Chlorella virus CvsA1]
MDFLEEFKTDVKKLIEHLNEEVRKYEFEKEEEYDPIIGKIIYDYCKQCDTLLIGYVVNSVFYDESEDYLTKYCGSKHVEDDMPRDYFDYIMSKDMMYEAGIGTIIMTKDNMYVYKNGKYPTFILENIHLVYNKRKIVYTLTQSEYLDYEYCHL